MRNGNLQLKEFQWPFYLRVFKIESFGEVGIIFKNPIYTFIINLTLKEHPISNKKKAFLDSVSFDHFSKPADHDILYGIVFLKSA